MIFDWSHENRPKFLFKYKNTYYIFEASNYYTCDRLTDVHLSKLITTITKLLYELAHELLNNLGNIRRILLNLYQRGSSAQCLFQKYNLLKAVKNCAEAITNVFWSCLLVLFFFALVQIFWSNIVNEK